MVTAAERTSACSDCGAQVPTLATGRGRAWNPERCPASTSPNFPGHRVPRVEFEAAEAAEREESL